MDKEIVIKVNNLTKIYQLFDRNKDRIKEALNPFGTKYSRNFYALNNINFEVKKGEAVGIIGRNGAGKSTLLKIITGVLTPTLGSVEVSGKIAALLELGAGFNPEMTGLENVYLNGALMGFTKEEVDKKLQFILEFADIGDYVYQPIKTYSSGMLVRLAFAVQTQVEPDILIVDEALAVGDALFQKRCFQKINELVVKGTTILFVSHDEELVRTMTNRAVFLINGEIAEQGLSSDVVLAYRKFLHDEEKEYWESVTKKYNEKALANEKITLAASKDAFNPQIISQETTSHKVDRIEFNERSFGGIEAEIMEVKIFNKNDEEQNLFYPKDIIKIKVNVFLHKDLTNLNVALRIRNKEGIKIYSWGTLNQDIGLWTSCAEEKGSIFWEKTFSKNNNIAICFESICTLGQNLYEVQVVVSEETDRFYGKQRILHWKDEAAFFTVNVARREYFFGGVCDMKMKAEVEKIG